LHRDFPAANDHAHDQWLVHAVGDRGLDDTPVSQLMPHPELQFDALSVPGQNTLEGPTNLLDIVWMDQLDRVAAD